MNRLFWEHLGNMAVREGDWKLVGHGDPSDLKRWHLSDLSKERAEVVDLARKLPNRVKQMAAAWIQWAERTGLHSEYSEKSEIDFPAKGRRNDGAGDATAIDGSPDSWTDPMHVTIAGWKGR